MKEGFRKKVEHLGKIAKSELVNEKVGIVDRKLSAVIDRYVTVAIQKTPPFLEEQAERGQRERRIYSLQKYKQEVMARLGDDIKKIDIPGYQPDKLPGQIEVTSVGGKYYALDSAGNKQEITAGEIMTDGVWGIDYFLPPSIPRNTRKRYLIETAKREIFKKLNEQIALDSPNVRALLNNSRELDESIKDERKLKYDSTVYGTAAEIMLSNFFKKLDYDHNSGIEVVDADVSQDAESKIDFIIKVKTRERGVGVQTDEAKDYKDIGVQLTTAHGTSRSKKRKALEEARPEIIAREKVADVVMVTISRKLIIESFDKWRLGHNKCGGPDKNIPMEIKQILFEKVLTGIFTPQELRGKWAQMKIEDRAPVIKESDTGAGGKKGTIEEGEPEEILKFPLGPGNSKYAQKRALRYGYVPYQTQTETEGEKEMETFDKNKVEEEGSQRRPSISEQWGFK